ncbi:MAG: hypothetical protein OJF61_001632 [Rhodanobacteraceae bacterium]|jgi:hypothetical protein|nr:MAG: hypothetical protein OJF61_001632 [Rhodanobacteraceae bacterium]
MNKFLTFTGITFASIALAACSPGINEGIGHRITFDSSGMVVHATGKPDAHVGKDGSLAIDGRTIDVTPAQRAMLQRYYGEARSMMQSGEAVGKQGAAMAERGIGDALTSLLHGDSSNAEKKMEAQSNQMDSAVGKLCADLGELGATQTAVAMQIPAFRPYASGARTECKVTKTVTFKDGRTITKTSRTFSSTPSDVADSAATPASSRQPGAAGNPDASTASHP